MNAPNSPQGRSSENEPDPTGMRDLLASLPDPGPMPDHVMQDIQAALAQEQQQRAGDHTNVSPLVGRSTTAEQGQPQKRSRGARFLRPLAAVGAAAAIGIGALAGYQSLSSNDSAPVANPPGEESQSQDAGSWKDRVNVQHSGRDYTRTGLATQAAALKHPTTSGAPAASDDAEPMSNPQDVLSCIRSITGGGIPDRISADLGQYEGKPAVIVVVTDDGKSKVWVVSRTCSGGKGKIAGPTAVT